ncbi:MAG: hypothetical protein HZB91_12530 [Elusimicrobia bacterium]|nr:hypothetical protein [Elusimicrobiota bacterium]
MWLSLAVSALVLFAPGPASAKTDDIPPGYRALSLDLPAHEWQYLTDGGRLDFLVSFEARLSSGGKRRVAATLLQNVLVRKLMPPLDKGGPGTAQLYLNPNEAAYFALSTNGKNKITVIERGPNDTAMAPTETSTLMKMTRRSRVKSSPRPPTHEGLIPKGDRALAVPLPLKILQGLKKGSAVDVYAASERGRLLLAQDALVLDARQPTAAVPEGTAWLATTGGFSQDIALAVFEHLELEFQPAQGAP